MSKEIERYPDPNQFDEKLFKNILKLPNDEILDIDLVRKHIWDEAESFTVPKEKIIRGMQANMFIVSCTNKSGDNKEVIVKRIVPKELPEKPSLEIWQGFITSVRTEIDFYQELLEPENKSIRHLFPTIFRSSGTGKQIDHVPMDTAFSIIMQDLNQDYTQKPMMNGEEAKLVLQSLARLHAHYWDKIPNEQRGSFWVLKKRSAFSEVENADSTWNSFIDRFPDLVNIHPGVRQIGSLLASQAEKLDQMVSVGANTRIHGDAKGWNFFFAKEGSKAHSSQPFLFIDMQWTGRGHPLQDVAYALTTTLSEEALEDMDTLVDYYIDTLGKLIIEITTIHIIHCCYTCRFET